ncbi:MAG: hypothetical protein AAF721_14185 [Myxococcota bacterium]
MRLRYKELRLVIPSLYQINKKGAKGGSDWCGRTSAAMIYNYYKAARAGGIDNALSELVINRRDRAPYDLVLPDDTVAVHGYNLLPAMQRAKPEGWALDPDPEYWGPPALHPLGSRSAKPSESEIRKRLAPLLTALEMFNPALFYSGLSSNVSKPRHIVVISGYRIGPRGNLWLHIDDPGSLFRLDAKGDMAGWGTHGHVTAHVDEQVLIQLKPDSHEEMTGRRYWLLASRLFDPNHHSARGGDLWCDHCDRPGMRVYYNDKVPEPASVCVMASAPGAGLPIEFVDAEGGGPSAVLPLAWANACASGAPYPLGGNRTWHNGIHLRSDEGTVAGDTIRAVAPGEIIFVRFPERGPDDLEDAGAVLVRHAFDPASLRLLDPRSADTTSADTVWLYSLSMNMLGGSAGAATFLSRLEHGSKPKPREFLRAPAPCTLFGYDTEGKPVAVDTPFEVGRETPKEETFELEAAGAKHHGVLADAVRSNLEVWEDGQPQVPLAPAGATLGVFDPLTGEVIDCRAIAEGEVRRMTASCNENGAWHYDVAAPGSKTWVITTCEAGIQLGDIKHCIHDGGGKSAMAKVPAGHGVAFVRERLVPISVDRGARKSRGQLAIKAPAGGEPMWCKESRSQPALKKKATASDVVTPELIPCVASDAGLKKRFATQETPHAYSKSRLRYYNPATGAIWDTTLWAESAPVVADEDERYLLGGKYAKLQGYEIEVTIRQGSRACAHDRDTIDEMLATPDDAWPLLTCWEDALPLYTVTSGKGSRRSFPNDSLITLDGKARRLSLREGPVVTSGRTRAWPDVSLVAGLSGVQYATKHAELAGAFAGPDGQTLGRLTRGESRLFGAQISKYSGWQVVDGALTVREDYKGDTLALFVEISGTGRGRYFPEKVDDCNHPILAVPAGSVPALRVVSEFRSGPKTRRDRALVEVCPAAPLAAMADNADEQQAWQDAEDFANKARDAVLGGDLVVLADLGKNEAFADWAMTGLDPIGRMGPAATGAHFEMFCGENLLPSDGPNGLWREIRGPSGADPVSEEFYADVVGKILDDPRLDDLARSETDATGSVHGGRNSVPIPAEQWRKFCSKPRVHRAMSRIIAVHPTEWGIDWEAMSQEYALVRWGKNLISGPTLKWWPTDLELLGIEDDDWFFYHPLRLLEWLTTGVDARIELASDKAVGMQLDLGGEPFEMAPSDVDEEGEIFRVRTVVGDVAECVDAIVVLEGVDTANPRIPVELQRGELLDIWLCEPGVVLEHAPRSSAMRSAVPALFSAEFAAEDTGLHLMADTSPHLASCGHSRATYVVEAQYNIECPTKLKLKLSDPALSIERVTLVGAVALPEDQKFGGDSFECALTPRGEAPETVTMYRTVAARVDVVVSDKVGVDGTLEATISGGDLASAVTVQTSIATRVIADGARGQDVAKLQHYLHQIQVDGQPCYRKTNGGTAKIDGDAGNGTARAIWRFVLHFCASPDWDRDFSSVAASKKAKTLTFEAPAAGTIDKAADDALKEFGHPEVGAELIAELVRHYGMPSVLPVVTLSVTAPAVDAEMQPLVEKMSAKGKTTLMPHAGHGLAGGPVELGVGLATPVPGDAADVDVTIRLGEGSPFALVGAAPKTLAALLSGGLQLATNGTISEDAKACTVTVAGPGGTTLGTLRLGGTRDLLAGGSNAKCLDGAQVQIWLADYPKDDSGAGFYTGDLDAEFVSGSVKALKAFRAQVSPEGDYATLLGLLAAGPPAAPGAAAEEAP